MARARFRVRVIARHWFTVRSWIMVNVRCRVMGRVGVRASVKVNVRAMVIV